jgi:GntR family transcriptional regulator
VPKPLHSHTILRAANQRLAQANWGSGRSIWQVDLDDRSMVVDRLTVERRDCPAHIAAALGVETGAPVWVRDRRYSVEGAPVMLATSYLDAALVDGSPITRPAPGTGGIYARLADLGRAPATFREQVRCRMPLPDEADALALGAGTPVVLIVRFAYDAEGSPVEVNEMVLDASRYVMEWEFPA